MTKRCIIIGAGASHGYDNGLVERDRPPTGENILSVAVEKKILSEGKYPHFLRCLKDYCIGNQKDALSFSKVDIEDFLNYIARELEKIVSKLTSCVPVPTAEEIKIFSDKIRNDLPGVWEKVKESFSENGDSYSVIRRTAAEYQSVIGESWYLMFELFRYYSIVDISQKNAYEALARYHLKNDYDLISLNYDVLFELAAEKSGMVIKYPETRPSKVVLSQKKVIPIAKVHGSINWFNSYSSGLPLKNTTASSYDLLKEMAGFIFSNRVNAFPLKIMSPKSIKKFSIERLLWSGKKYYEPALLPPVGNYKDYEKVKYFSDNWNEAKKMVADADELVLIGTRLRSADDKMRRLLQDNAKSEVDLYVAGSQPTDEELMGLLGKDIGIRTRFKYFTEFVESLNNLG